MAELCRLPLVLALLLASCGTSSKGSQAAGTGGGDGPSGLEGSDDGEGMTIRALCPDDGSGRARCHAQVVVVPPGKDVTPPPASAAGDGGATTGAEAAAALDAYWSWWPWHHDGLRPLTPNDIQKAYNLPANGGAGQTVALVDAYDNPNAEADLAVYRERFNLPPCTTANGCFKKVNKFGVEGQYPPTADDDWAGEISLDLAAVSAACPACKILLVEADTQYDSLSLGSAVTLAVTLGAAAVSNSYGWEESTPVKYTGGYTVQDLAPYFDSTHGIAITVSSGDGGYQVNFPASAPHAIAVGGTSLKHGGGGRGWTETAWSGAGSGISSVFQRPPWQQSIPEVDFRVVADFYAPNDGRVVADVSAVADPRSGLNVYLSNFGGKAGWQVIGGTSLASPLVAAAMVATGIAGNDASYFYSHPNAMYDVTSGSNGECESAFLCRSGPGYDGPTGVGSPNASGWVNGAKAGCYTQTLGKLMPHDACVQSEYDEMWYQCDDGKWVARWADTDVCSSSWPLAGASK